MVEMEKMEKTEGAGRKWLCILKVRFRDIGSNCESNLALSFKGFGHFNC